MKALPALDSDRTVVFAFGSTDLYDSPRPLEELAHAYPSSKLVGCSTAGEIHGTTVRDGTISVAVVRFDSTSLRQASADVAAPEQSCQAGRAIARQLAAPDLRAVVLFSDGLRVNGSELTRGINTELPRSVVVTGGLGADGDRFQRTWVLDGGLPRTGKISAIGLYGSKLDVRHGSKGGWDIFGPERRVTRAVGNVLYELDDRPALELYKRYLGERASGLPATALLFPLAIRSRADSDILVRTILAVDETNQSLTFAGEIPEGWLAQLMRANFDRLIDGASSAALACNAERSRSGPTLAIAISCVGRRLVLGERTEEEIEATLDVLPPGTEQVGFYSYGEISPHASGDCSLHNQTMTLTTIAEV